MKNSVKAFAPATVANVSCGFDIFGFALEKPGDVVILTITDTPGVTIKKVEGDCGKLPWEADKNTAGIAATLLLRHLKKKIGVEIELSKKMPLSSGLGSSAASSVAVLTGLNDLLGSPLSKDELLPFALETEEAACGSAHADNVAPSLLGGFVLIRSYDPLDVIKLPVPDDLYCCLIHPDVEVLTKDARSILPAEIKLKDAVTQWGNIAGFIAGLMQRDYELISRSMQDVIIEPARAKLIPHFHEVKEAVLSSGALGCSISGSGPSIFALCQSLSITESVAEVMKAVYDSKDFKSNIYVSKINNEGSRLL